MRQNSALRIFLYNWPVYAATWAAAAAGVVAYATGRVPGLPACVAFLPMVWSSISLWVSWYIYDRSALRQGSWLKDLLPAGVQHWATVHAGLDAEVALDGMPGACAARLDIFDPDAMPAGSIARARHRTPPQQASTMCPPTALALPDGTCDAIVVAFSAHEIHDPRVRERFFAEVHRCLRPAGRMVLVEHVRDMANFAVFGPGHMHFLPRKEWLRLAAGAGFAIAAEKRVTPWVMALSLEANR